MVIDCDWEFLSKQRTLRAPHEPMPRLIDLLEYLAEPGKESIWLLLDIKVLYFCGPLTYIRAFLTLLQLTNNAEDIMRLLASTIDSVPPSPTAPWNQRIVLGCWAAKFLPLCAQYLPTFAITNIGFSIPYARGFLPVPNISFNTLQNTLMGPRGPAYMRELKAKKRPLYIWTVNTDYGMRWSIGRGLDGVITDDPKRFLEVVEEWEMGKRDLGHVTWASWGLMMWINLMVWVFEMVFYFKYGGNRQGKHVRKAIAMTSDRS